MKLSQIGVGSPILIDINRDGKKCVTTIVQRVLETGAVLTSIPLDSRLNGNVRPLLECTNTDDSHVYCYRNLVFGVDNNLMTIMSDEDSDFHSTRQERRFRFRSHCQLKTGASYYNDSTINDVSLSGMSLVIPKRHAINVGDQISIIAKYTDNSKHFVELEIKRITPYDDDNLLYGCIVVSGGEFNKLIIERLKFA